MTEVPPAIVITGPVVSTTSTVLVTVVVLPDGSVATYVMSSVFITEVLIEPNVSSVYEPELSVTVTSGSVYVLPNSAVTEVPPAIVITGPVVSTTLTVLVSVAEFPEASVAVYVSV